MMYPSSSRAAFARHPTTEKSRVWTCACSEAAWRLANLAAIPCEMIANWKVVVDNGVQKLNN